MGDGITRSDQAASLCFFNQRFETLDLLMQHLAVLGMLLLQPGSGSCEWIGRRPFRLSRLLGTHQPHPLKTSRLCHSAMAQEYLHRY